MDLLTKRGLYDYVRNTLGRGSVEVELQDAHINAAIDAATTLVNMYCPAKRWVMIPSVGLGRYVFPKMPVPTTPVDLTTTPYLINVPGVQRVIRVEGVRERATASQIDLFDPLVYIAGGVASMSGLADYNAGLSYLQESRKRLNATAEFRTVKEYDETLGMPVIALYFSAPQLFRYVYGAEVAMNTTPDDNPRTGLAYIPDGVNHWFTEYVLARCQYTLGRILGKFGGLPGPDGNVLPLDNEDLRKEGSDAMRDLVQELMNMRPSLPPLLG